MARKIRSSKKDADRAKHEAIEQELIEKVTADDKHGQRFRDLFYRHIGGGVYKRQIENHGSDLEAQMISASAHTYVAEMIDRMKPRDPLEEMVVLQAVWAHGRAAHLSGLANQQTRLDAIRQINDSADKASNTFRRLMLALAEYRAHPRAGDTYTAINQANIAAQQVVQNGPPPPVRNQKTRRTNKDSAMTTPPQPRRPYRLTPKGLRSLQSSIRRTKPWLSATGPATPAGKARAAMNAWKHGERSQAAIEARRQTAAVFRVVNGSTPG